MGTVEMSVCSVSSPLCPVYIFYISFCLFAAVQQDSGVSPPEATLEPGHSAQLHTAVINQSSLDLHLINYLAQDWSTEYKYVFSTYYLIHYRIVIVNLDFCDTRLIYRCQTGVQFQFYL